MRVRSRMVVAATMALAALGAAPAQADGARTLTGPSTGDADVFLTYVGCEGLLTAGTAPQSRLNLGPYDAPLGRRSLGLVPSAPGTASGPFARFGSLESLDSSLSVASTSGTRGVSHIMSITASSPPGTAWSGRAALTVAPGAWSNVTARTLTYDWSLVDLATLTPVAPAGSASPSAFAAEHGDGAGFVVTGFGCDGKSFNLDAVSGSGSTFDFEGITLATAAAVDRTQATAGDEVTVSGRVTDVSGRLTGDPLVLESRVPGGEWRSTGRTVLSNPTGLARVDVAVTETTEFRWHRPESQYADEGWSETVTVTVEPPATAPEASTSPDGGAGQDGNAGQDGQKDAGKNTDKNTDKNTQKDAGKK